MTGPPPAAAEPAAQPRPTSVGRAATGDARSASVQSGDRGVVPSRPDRIIVMGVVNVTPDSFSDGGRYLGVPQAVEHAVGLVAAGADLVDVGGESTRPGANRVPAAEESRRVLPVITSLADQGIAVSVDTYRASVAEAALSAGAVMINDVSGGLADPGMASVVRDARCAWILMHWRGHSASMATLAHYGDVVAEVRAELVQRIDAVTAAGVDPAQLIIDPGIGFAKTAEHNWLLLANLATLRSIGLPILVAASRKSFLGALLADESGAPRPVEGREDATVALTTHAALSGAWGVRVHDVARNVDAALVAARVRAAEAGPAGVGPPR